MGRSEQFFHGTVHDIPVHHLVLPGSVAGHHNYDMDTINGESSLNHAFATTHEQTAWEFANGNTTAGMRTSTTRPPTSP